VAVFSIEPIELIAGGLPSRQRRLAEAWAELQQADSNRDSASWRRAARSRT